MFHSDLAEIGVERTQYVLRLRPIDLADANAFVQRHHRHHVPVQGHKFSLAAFAGGTLVGVAIVGRPVARMEDDDTTLEVTRLATNGCANACSFLYGAARRAARALGYQRIVTFILESEPGTSLRAAGWSRVGSTNGGTWSRADRAREDWHPLEGKVKWESVLDRTAKITKEIAELARTYGVTV